MRSYWEGMGGGFFRLPQSYGCINSMTHTHIRTHYVMIRHRKSVSLDLVTQLTQDFKERRITFTYHESFDGDPMIMDESVKKLFAEYEKAFAELDFKRSAEFFADTFISAGPRGVIAQSKAEFLKLAHQAAAFYVNGGVKLSTYGGIKLTTYLKSLLPA